MEDFIVITGCDSGIGEQLHAQYKAAGRRVIGTTIVQEEKAIPELQYLDLRSSGSVQSFLAAVGEARRSGGRLKLLILNAGAAVACPIEYLPEAKLREIMEINFFGNFRIVKALMPIIREDRTRLCIVSSSAGRLAPPFFAAYACSKFAMEALGDCLRRELRPFGVSVVIFEPRSIATPIWEKTWSSALHDVLPVLDEEYRERMNRGGRILVDGAGNGMSAAEAAAFIIKKAKRKRPAARYIVSEHRILTWLQYRLPAALADTAFARIFRR